MLEQVKVLQEKVDQCAAQESNLEKFGAVQLQLLEKFFEPKLQALQQQIDQSVNLNSNILAMIEDFKKQLDEQKAKPESNRREPQVDDKFKKIASKYYYIEHSDRVNWYKADDICRSMGGYLVNIESQDEFDELVKHLIPAHMYWIGINDLANEGVYRTTATGRAPKFLKWSPHNPNNIFNEDCVELWYVHNKYQMNDGRCNHDRHFICEKS